MKDFYYILGLEPDCSFDAIKEAYRKLSKKLHPDLNQGDDFFDNRFRDVKEAFETLRDPVKRGIYDEQFKNQKQGSDLKKQDYAGPAANPGPAYRTAQRGQGKTAARRIRKRRMGVGLSLTLLVIGVISGVYLIDTFATSKPVAHVPVKDTVSVKPVIHKKLRHHHLDKTEVALIKSPQKYLDTVKKVAAQPPIVQPLAPAPEPVKPVQVKKEPLRPMIAKTWPDSSDTHSDYLYTTVVHPNVTGIVQMRRQNRFDSNIIASIPANAKVYVLERGNTYYRVFYDHNIGFVPKWALHQK